MELTQAPGAWDHFLSAVAIVYIILQSLFFVWLFGKIIGGICTLVFEREKIHSILGYAGDKKTPLLVKPFAFILWLVLIIASCILSVVFSIFLLNAISNLFKR